MCLVTSDCPACYDWVQQQVRVVRQQVLTLTDIITYVMTRPPQPINDTEYLDQLMAVNETVNQLWHDASVHGNIFASFWSDFCGFSADFQPVFPRGVLENKSHSLSFGNSELLREISSFELLTDLISLFHSPSIFESRISPAFDGDTCHCSSLMLFERYFKCRLQTDVAT